jgi:hypothetical protein
LSDDVSEVVGRALGDASLGDGVSELGDIGASLHALPIQLIPKGAFTGWARRHTLSTELISVGEIVGGGYVRAFSCAEVVVRISIILVGWGAGCTASIICGGAVKPVRAFSDAGIVSEQCEGSVWTEFNACSVHNYPFRHVGVLIDWSCALRHAFLGGLVDVGEIRRCAFYFAGGSGRICSVGVGTAVAAISHRVVRISIVESEHLRRVNAVVDAGLAVRIRIGAVSANIHTCMRLDIGVSE